MAKNDTLLVRPREVADLLGLSLGQVYRMLRAGDLPHIRIGTTIRVSRDTLTAWIAAQEHAHVAAVAVAPLSTEPEV